MTQIQRDMKLKWQFTLTNSSSRSLSLTGTLRRDAAPRPLAESLGVSQKIAEEGQ